MEVGTEVQDRFFTPTGRLHTIPSKQAKLVLVLDRVAQAFEPGIKYPEAEVNAILLGFHDDYAALRRYLVENGFLSREGGIYWRTGGTVDVEGQSLTSE